MSTTDPRQAQRRASDPDASAFVTANAGSGKTTTLVDRVARLLLARAAPEAILCVTYTKAAAAEMQRRLFQQLGDWSVMQDERLALVLAELHGHGHSGIAAEELSAARALFARALEAPGGLKIQTIHAFCEKLLKRFPLEAQVSPGFKVMDDADASQIAHQARAFVAEAALYGQGPLPQAYARMATALAFDDFQSMFAAFETNRAALADYVEGCGDVEADVWRRCGFDAPTTAEAVEADALARLDLDLWRACAALLAAGTKTDNRCGLLMAQVAKGGASLSQALAALFTKDGEGDPATWPGKTSGLKSREDLRARLVAEQVRLADAREDIRAAQVAEDTVRALVLAQAYVGAYEQAKRAAGALDFADLILKTRELLTRTADAAWVLYKLDGGIDHILLDEAQDTAPEQWAIVDAVSEEFFVGAGAVRLRPGLERTLFVVGDEKQSIYSFQGADPTQLKAQTDAYDARIVAAGRRSEIVPLLTSFRSAPQVLAFVDGLFAERAAWPGVAPPHGEEMIRHLAHRVNENGCVDLWPPEQEEAAPEPGAWDTPLDEEGPRGANRRLAERIAGEIKALVERGELVKGRDEWRPAGYGDVLILVRRRRVLFEEILRALKRLDVPVAGADRLSLSQHIAFDDLVALARFILFPGDDLTLAALLKAPFLALDEASLFQLAYGRERATLWSVLQRRAVEREDWAGALAFLERCRSEAAGRRPFDLYSRVLGFADARGRSVRAAILERLGGEAQDVLDEFLAQVLAAERAGVCDLERLVQAFDGLDIAVKREMEGARGEVRVMTVHGAKGLEAPIVFLPETTPTQSGRGSPLLPTQDGGFLWATSKARDCAASAAARAWRAGKDEREAQRLFYVALTRARDRLVLGGRINARGDPAAVGGWYGAARAALASEALAPLVREIESAGMTVTRYGPDPVTGSAAAPSSESAETPLPAWARTPAPPETLRRLASPSRLGDETPDGSAAPSPLTEAQGLGRYRRGDLIHRLLQALPDIPTDGRQDAALRMLARERDVSPAQAAEMAAAALGVLDDPRFAAVFGPGSRAEVAIAGLAPGVGPISGRVDRLLIEPDRVLVVDFKTNRPSPARIEAADPVYLAQMAVYGAVLRAIFPERRIEAALVWTDGPKLMPVPEELRTQALVRLSRSVDSSRSTP